MATDEIGAPSANAQQAAIDFALIKQISKQISLFEFARGVIGPIATTPGLIDLPIGCTWQDIWEGGNFSWPREYRITNSAAGSGEIEIEIDGVVLKTALKPGQSRDVSGHKIRVHNPLPPVTVPPSPPSPPSSGSYERL